LFKNLAICARATIGLQTRQRLGKSLRGLSCFVANSVNQITLSVNSFTKKVNRFTIMRKELESPLYMLRRLRRITQKELANELGVTETTVRNWEAGRSEPSLTIPQTKKLCKVLGITLDELPDSFAPQPINPPENAQ
jgi:putative transcriptional regulator